MKKKLGFLSFFTIFLFIFSCTTGLGTEIDLVAPVLKITHINGNEFVNNQYVPLKFTISGIATDNIGVTQVSVTYKDAGQEKVRYAKVNGESWACDVDVTENKEIQFDIVATDKSKNTSAKSKKTITLIVDASSPSVKSLTITENKQTNLLPKTELDAKQLEISSDKDYFHNEDFTINATIQDNFSVASSTLKLVDESGINVYSVENSNENQYSPTFIIDTKDFPKSGRHNFRPIITTNDGAGNKSEDKAENKFEDKYLCWYPESDIPKVNIIGSENNELTIIKSSPIPVSVFDDDGLGSINYKLITSSEWNSLSGSSIGEKINKVTGFESITVSSGERDKTFQKDCNEGGDYYFVVKVTDAKTNGNVKTGYSATKVTVTSQDKPILIISNPKDNDLPTLNNKNFTISAYILDDQNVNTLNLSYTVGTGANVKEYTKSFTKQSGNTKEGDSFKSIFTGTLNIETDFKDKSGAFTNELKKLRFYATDIDGNQVEKTISIPAFTKKPNLQIQLSTTSGSGYEQVGNFYHTPPTTLYMKVNAQGQNGLNITNTKVDLSIEGEQQTSPTKTGNYYTIPNPNTECNSEIKVTVTDELGNTEEKIISISYSPIPALKSITCDAPNNKIFVKGEKLILMASFTTPVKVSTNNGNSIPYIKLLNSSGTEIKQAKFVSGNNSEDLIFEYTVEDNVEINEIHTNATNALVIPNGGTIQSLEYVNAKLDESISTLQSSKTLSIDSKKPIITGYTPEKDSKATITNNNVEIKLTFSEPVKKDKGYITVQRTKDWAVPIVFTKEDFLAVYNKMNSANRIKMIGADQINNFVRDPITNLSKGPYRGMQHGLVADGSTVEGVKPDTSTKYVLEYNLDPHSTTGDVLGTRQALESVDYHKVTIDVTSSFVKLSNNNKTVSITVESDFLGDKFFVDGREFEVTVDDTCFMDMAGNRFKGIKNESRKTTVSGETDYKFWNGKVATPVVRVNRLSNVSGGNYAKANSPELPSTISGNNGWVKYAVDNDVRNIKPTGMIGVRVDCETPGATLNYDIDYYGIPDNVLEAIISRTSTGNNVTTQNAANGNGSTVGNVNAPTNPSQNFGKFTAINPSTNSPTNSTVSFTVGEASLYKPFRYYINATASKTDFTTSNTGKEGAYKTVVMLKDPGSSGGDRKILLVEGTSLEGGESHMSDFPVKDNTRNPRYTRIAYTIDANETGKDKNPKNDIPVNNWNSTNKRTFVYISYDYISDWYMQTVRNNFQHNENHDKRSNSNDFNKSHCGYGSLYFYYGMEYWS